MNKQVVLKPRLSEKAYGLSEERNTYVFEVARGVNTHSVALAVAEQYEVSVENVRMAGTAAKNKRTYQRGGRVTHRGQTSPVRKAYVTLKEGDKLPIFAAVEDSNQAPEDKGKK